MYTCIYIRLYIHACALACSVWVYASEHACVRIRQGLFQSRSLGASAHKSYMYSIVYRHIYACRGLGVDSRSPSFNCCFRRCDSILPIYMRDLERCQFTLPSWHSTKATWLWHSKRQINLHKHVSVHPLFVASCLVGLLKPSLFTMQHSRQ